MTSEPASIIREAREILQLNQSDFSNLMRKSQGVISKYETGQVQPSANIIIHCMNIIDAHKNKVYSDNLEDLIRKINTLNEGQYTTVRVALNILLDSISHNP